MALDDLPQIGITSYNGYTWPNASVETVGYSVRALYDPANRTVWACEFTQTLKWTIEAGTADDTQREADEITAVLMRPAGVLLYEGRGFGPPDVNGGRIRDVDWGPRPQDIKFSPTGAGRATEVVWTVKFTLPTCDDAVFDGIAWFNFTVDYDRDKSGYSTRTYTGKLRIAQTRRNARDRAIIDTADRFLERVVPAQVPGFRRQSVKHGLSEDKCLLTVTVVDTELPPNVPPPGLIDGSVEHNWSSKPGTLGYQWTGTFNASYEIARRDGTALDAINDFLNLADDRITLAQTMRRAAGAAGGGGALDFLGAAGGGAAGEPIGRKSIVPQVLSAKEANVYGKTEAHFSLSYFVAGVQFDEILARGGLWKPWRSTAADWKAWSASLVWALDARGSADLVFRPGDDRIVDLCGAAPPIAGQPVAPGQTFITNANGPRPGFGGALGGAGAGAAGGAIGGAAGGVLQKIFPPPAADGSWLAYHCFVTITADTGRIVGTTLPSRPLSTDRGGGGSWDVMKGEMPRVARGSSAFPPLARQLDPQQSGRGQTFVQARTSPTLYVTLHGEALRVGYQIPVPELVSVNGATPVLVGSPRFSQGVVAEALYPVFGANWELTYVFTDDGKLPRGPVPVPPNPVLA